MGQKRKIVRSEKRVKHELNSLCYLFKRTRLKISYCEVIDISKLWKYKNTMIKLKIRLLQLLALSIVSFSIDANDFLETKTFSDQNTLQMVIEIPAGTNRKVEYDNFKNEFLINKINGSDRVINFLPYPGNYGFIPSTLMDKGRGGDGDALDILLISEQLDTGTILSVIPIGLLVLEDSDELDTKIIAVPASQSLQVINATSFGELKANYPALIEIIQLWFLNYKGNGIMEFIEWGDEIAALNEIDKWKVE